MNMSHKPEEGIVLVYDIKTWAKLFWNFYLMGITLFGV
jgi:hypothetical protein